MLAGTVAAVCAAAAATGLPWLELYALALWADLFKPNPIGLLTIIWYIPITTCLTCVATAYQLFKLLAEGRRLSKLLVFTLMLWTPVVAIPCIVLGLISLSALCWVQACK